MEAVVLMGGRKGAGRPALAANLAANLAVTAAALGLRTLLLDTDTRGGGGAADWWTRRLENGAGRALLGFDRCMLAAAKGRWARARGEGTELVLVDAGAAVTRAAAAMVESCDLAFLPVDLRWAGEALGPPDAAPGARPLLEKTGRFAQCSTTAARGSCPAAAAAATRWGGNLRGRWGGSSSSTSSGPRPGGPAACLRPVPGRRSGRPRSRDDGLRRAPRPPPEAGGAGPRLRVVSANLKASGGAAHA